nr:immunoglobulin light chain junction region [Macaca mulatta]
DYYCQMWDSSGHIF